MRLLHSVSDDDLQASHQGANLGQTPSNLRNAMARRWLSAAKFIVAPTIILLVAAVLLPVLINARKPTYEMRCIAQLRQVSSAVNMYLQDNYNYPLSHNWHEAIRPYIDDPNDPTGHVEPGSSRDPLKCPSDPTDSVVSYLYLNRNMLDYSKSHLAETVVPMVVDEYFHPNTTLAYYDGHAEKINKQLWLHARNRQWEIRRNLSDLESFSYEPVPGSVHGPQGAEPRYDRTQVYVWPVL